MRRIPLVSARTVPAIALAVLLALSPPTLHAAGVAWSYAAEDSDIERVFAQARSEKKPVLLYWGAKWCPPCNQLKATLFNRQDFIERSKAVVPVNIDGDLPGAQKLGARFKVRGYPTMILLTPEGTEITRLPGEADAPQVIAMLQRAQSGGRPVKTLLAEAQAGKPLSGSDWRALALYAWDTDQDQLVPGPERAGLLAQLSAACPPAETESATRLLFKALAASNESTGLKPDAALREKVRKLLAQPAVARAQMDTLVNFAPDITRALAPEPGAERRRVAAAFDTALQRLEADATMSRADRLSALVGRVELARLDGPKDALNPKLDARLLKQVRAHAARVDREITDSFERQAVVTGAGHMLAQAGLWTDSDALLKANLAKSHSPYYLMSQLAGNARKLGRKDEALTWYQQAFDGAEGPATRLQWGASYISALVELAPQDAERIERTVRQLFIEAGQDKSAFYERSARSLQRVGSKLAGWSGDGSQAALERLRTQLDDVCKGLDAADAQRATCESVARTLSPKPALT
ncbi:thioredoxin fold domain-containing protein [Ideonella sp. A 288]|uniref:thioredoxin fold domain-containing protein n=1 Tax=Ideonella sp. A 288 TaxID=1962181 RepID=UPI000B4BCBA7|nr:thioredoxin fold domain-containing protein [Ideonella sp. A 288]